MAGVWLILLIRMMLEKIGFVLKLKEDCCILKIVVFIMLFGIRLGVNCMWEKLIFIVCVISLVVRVLVIFGIFFSSICLLENRVVISNFSILF